MTGTFFDYFDGYLRVEFSQTSYDGIGMVLTVQGDAIAATPCNDSFEKGRPEITVNDEMRIVTGMSATFCPFPSLIAWLEAMTVGVQECAFNWDDEGPDGELRWHNSWKSGQLTISWSARDQQVKHKVRLNKAQMIRAFYEAFRDFVESERYDPLRYEELNAGECCALVLEGANLDALADALAALDRRSAQALIDTLLDLAYDDKAGYPRRATLADFVEKAGNRVFRWIDEENIGHWFTEAWDSWGTEQRRLYVVETVFQGGVCISFGSKLRELRSPLVEQWLTLNAESNIASEIKS